MAGKRFTDIKCGDWSCEREGPWVPAGADTAETLRPKLESSRSYGGKKVVITDEDVENSLANLAKCGIHGPGVAKRQKYGTPTQYVAIETRPDIQQAARAKQARDRAAEQQRAQQRADENRKHHENTAVTAWRNLADEEDYVLRYEEEDRYGDGKVKRQWSVYTTAQVEKAAESGDPTNIRYSPAFRIELVEDQPYPDVTRPAYLRTMGSNQPTSKLAPFVAEATVKAAEVLAATNARRLAKHEREKQGWS